MLKEFVDKLLTECAPIKIEVDERPYSSKALHPVKPPLPTPLKLMTLDSFVEFCKQNEPDKDTYFVHIEDQETVVLVDHLTDLFEQRGRNVEASCEEFAGEFEFGRFMDAETFVIALQSKFVDSHDRAKVLAVVGNIAVENNVQTQDDGVTQSVSQNKGVTLKSKAELPNPVELAPFRTFREVGQPVSKFILRAKSEGPTNKPMIALFEADGAAWKLNAIKGIQTYLAPKLEGWKILS